MNELRKDYKTIIDYYKDYIIVVYYDNPTNYWLYNIFKGTFNNIIVHVSTGKGQCEQNETEKQALRSAQWKVDCILQQIEDDAYEFLINQIAKKFDLDVDDFRSELINLGNTSFIDESIKALRENFDLNEKIAKRLLSWGQRNYDLPNNYNF
jgi:hypothetical protein